MTCFHPRKGYRGPGGIVFNASGPGSAKIIAINCGQCSGCALDYGRQFAIRAMHESQMHLRNSFITLTIDDEHLDELETIRKTDWQKFAKKLRHKMGPFRFLMCGEYGEKLGRPHYHALLFGIDFHEDREPTKDSESGNPLWKSKILDETWGMGKHNPIGQITFESAAYVAKYALKKIKGDKAKKHYGEKEPEFALMSRNKGIGNSWFQKYYRDIYNQDTVEMNGKMMRPPKYYDGLYAKMEPEKMERIKNRRIEEINKRPEEYTKVRLAEKERASKKRMAAHKRENAKS